MTRTAEAALATLPHTHPPTHTAPSPTHACHVGVRREVRCLGVYRTAEAAGRAYDLCALAGSKKPGRLNNARPGANTLGEVLQMVGAGVPCAGAAARQSSTNT